MQTFVPYEVHEYTAEFLDNKRLFKQIVECKQILLALDDPGYGWQNHPAVRMWRGHDEALAEYTVVLCAEWRYRGTLRPSRAPYRESISEWVMVHYDYMSPTLPPWWGGPIHKTHVYKLLWKDPEWYGKKLGYIAPKIEPAYFWPLAKES